MNDDAVILSGEVSSNDVMLRAAEVAKAAFPKAAVVNMLQLPGGSPSKQVMLQVRFAEVNRNALLQAGITLFTTRAAFTSRSTTQQFAEPNFDDQGGGEPWRQRRRAGVHRLPEHLLLQPRARASARVLKALQGRGFLQSLAEPNLIAYNNEEASFLAGGEIPIPVVQGVSGQVTRPVQGVRHPPDVPADDRRRRDSPQAASRRSARSTSTTASSSPASAFRR